MFCDGDNPTRFYVAVSGTQAVTFIRSVLFQNTAGTFQVGTNAGAVLQSGGYSLYTFTGISSRWDNTMFGSTRNVILVR
jgi:hypothetical protein